MKLETYTLQIIITILCSVGVGALITAIANRKKTKAETQLLAAEYFTTTLNDLRTQVKMLSDQSKIQAAQILDLQKEKNGHVKLITGLQKREQAYLKQIKEQNQIIAELQNQLVELQTQILTYEKSNTLA